MEPLIAALPYTDKFKAALAFTLPWEAVYSHGHWGDLAHVIAEHDPDDPGGTTKYGIDARDHPGVDVENLTLEGAAGIYHSGLSHEGEIYAGGEWEICNCELMPDRWSLAIFECAVNPGRIDAKWVQQILHLHVDGVIGPQTIAAINQADDADLAAVLNRRNDYYRSLVNQRPRMGRYLQGWLDRNAALRKLLLPEVGSQKSEVGKA